jgi:subtilisin-like proprotein convertase family protein
MLNLNVLSLVKLCGNMRLEGKHLQLWLLCATCLVFFSPAQGQKDQTFSSDIVRIDLSDIQSQLKAAPMERTANAKPISLSLPMPDGKQRQFIVEENNVISGEFAAQFPALKTYSMQAADDPTVYGRLTVSPFGVRSTVFAKEGLISIDPVDALNPVMHKIQVSKGGRGDFVCGVSEKPVSFNPQKRMMMTTTPWSNGNTLKTYRFAIVTTYYYYELNGSSLGATQAAIAAVVNDLSAIYERELAVRFTLPAPYIYTNAAQSSLDFNPDIDRTQLAANAVAKHFQANTYDIGHAFHGGTYLMNTTWNGGVATTDGLCNDSKVSNDPGSNGLLKAAGWSSFPSATVSDNTLRVLVHEVGHMFSMPHSWNGDCSNVAAGQGNQIGDAYEIGSGSTIMSYRDVCSQFSVPGQPYGGIQPSPNNGDDYFHNVSLGRALTQISNHPTCGISSTNGNTPPVVDATPSGCNATYTVPKGTPFQLTGSSTDANTDPVYYCWEQYDEDGPGNPTQAKVGVQAAALTLAPLFRSYPPTTSPTRTFPHMSLVAANNYASNFEPLPTVARTMKFRLTGRDFRNGGGGIHYDTVNVTVSAQGPLTLTAPNTATTIAAGSITTVTWNGNGINFLTNVRIKMSADGGLTFPYTLLALTPNDGSQSVTIPTTVPGTTTAKIMVESADFTCFSFFDVSNVNFTITSACNPPLTEISPTTPLTAQSGSGSLNLGLTNNVGSIVTSFAGTITNTNPKGTLLGLDQNSQCKILGNPTYYTTHFLSVDVTGAYTFEVAPLSGRVLNLYKYPYTPNTCTNHIASNLKDAGSSVNNVTMNPTLTAGQLYVLVVSSFNQTNPVTPFMYTVTFPTKPGGSNVYNGVILPAGYSYTYAAVNTVTGLIAAVNATSGFGALTAGSYEVYGAVYYSGAGPNPPPVNPASWVGQSIFQVIGSGCARFSNNSKPVTVTPGANTPPSLAISGGGSTNEGNCTNGTFTFTVNRTGNLASQSTANWAVTGSSANAANAADFVGGVLPGGTVTFPAGSSSQTIAVTANADATDEPNEVFTITLSAPTNATIGTATATGTILDDDPFTSECSGAYCTAPHTGGTCGANDQYISKVVFAGINQSSTCANSLPAGYANYTCSGGATVSKGCGYPLQVTLGNPKSGDQVRAYFDWNDDGDFDDTNETFTLTGSGANFTKNITVPGNAAMGSTRMRVRLFATGASPAPCGSVAKGEAEDYCLSVGATGVSISSTASLKDEGNSGTTAFTFSVSRSCPSTVATTLNWQVSGSGTNPAAAADFPNSIFPSGSITFPAGSTAAQTITVNVNGDTNGEPDEQFTVSLSPQDNASIDISSATGTIKNDDGINVWITGSPSQNEGNSGTTAFTFTINRNLFNGTATAVNWAVTGNGANPASASDFNNSTFPNGTVTFSASSGLSQTINVNVKGDTGVEQNEGFTVTLSSPTNGTITTATANGAILNDDAGAAPTVAISGSPSLNEGNAGSTAFTFTATRTGSTTIASSAQWAVTGSGTNPGNATDFGGGTFPSGTVTFPASSSATQSITVNVNGDLTNELDETFTVTLSNPTNATITAATAGGTILGDDGYCAASTVGGTTFERISDVAFNTINNNSTSNAGYQNFTSISTTVTQGATYGFTATIAGGGADEEIIVWIDYNQDFDFADPGEEVFNSAIGTGPFNSNIIIPGGATTGTTRMRVRLNDTGNMPMNSTPCGNSQYGQVEDYTINIIASVPSLAISGSPALTEGNSGAKAFEFTVTRTGNLTNASSASAIVTGSSGNPAVAADFTGGVFLNSTVNFTAGSATQTVVVSVNGDLTVESNEGFTVTLSSPTNATITTATASGTIQNDDVAGIPDIAIQAGPSINEGNAGTTAFNFTVVRTGSTTNQTTVDWIVRPVAVPHTANAGDFIGGVWQSGTVTFPAGSAANQTITVNVAGNTEIEVAELFNVDLSNPVNGNITTAASTASINNDDTPGSGCLGAYIQTAVLQGCQTSGQFISNVSFNTINNSSTCATSGNAGYTNYTGISTSVNRSASYPITVTHGGSNTGIAEVTVWFDWNADADFADAGEEFELTLGTFPNWTGNIAVPVGAVLGSTRMRVRMAGYATPVATGFQDAAEAEDYCITVLAACTPPTVNAPTVTQPTCSVATGSIVVNTGAGTFDYSINSGTTWQASATFSNLPPGNYNIKVRLQASPICTTAYASNPVVLAAAAGCGTALEFNPGAATDFVACGNILTSCYTKEVWVNVVPASGVENNFISGGGAALHAFWAPVTYGYRVSSGHNGTFNYVQDPNPIPTGWQHYAVTYNSSTQNMRLYKNGVLVSEAFNVPAATGTNMVQIGAFDSFGFDGSIDEVRIWNYARAEADILADYTNKLTGKEPGLIAYYDFEQGAPNGSNAGLTTLYDKALPANNGTLTGFALTGSTSNWTQPGAPVTSDGTTATTFYSVDLPITISDSGTPTVTSTLNFPNAGTITDIEVLGLDIDHTRIGHLRVKLKSPSGTERILLNQICNTGLIANILLDLDDESANTYASIPCPPNGGNYQPNQTLAAFDGENAEGIWTLTIEDLANIEGGTLQNWGISIDYVSCATPVITAPTVTQTSCTVSTGTIVVNAACSGTLEYSVNNGATWQASATFANLPPGAYNIKVRLADSKFCETAYGSNPALIEEVPAPPTINEVMPTQATCTAPTGTIVVDAIGIELPSTPPSALEYSRDNGTTWQTSNTFSGLAAGSYTIKVRLQSSPACMTTYAANPVVLVAATNCTPAKSLDFDGTNDYVALPANMTASLTNFTFEAWVYWDGANNWQQIFDFGNSTSVYMQLTPSSGSNSSKPAFAIANGGGEQIINSSVSATLNQWQHYAVVLDDAANTGVLYLDGVQVGSNTAITITPAAMGNLANTWLGRSQFFGSDPYFNGKMDDVRIWSIAKTSQQVQCEMDETLVGNEPGLVANYRFDQGFADGGNSGLDALDDLSANGNDGTLTNFALDGATSNWSGATGSGKVLDFATDDYVTGTNASLPVGNSARTIECWVKSSPASNGLEMMYNYGTSANSQRASLMFNSNGTLLYAGFANDLAGTTNIRDGIWHHCAATFDGTTLKVYVDGNLEASAAKTFATTGTNFAIGRRVDGAIEFLDGKLDELRVWNVARTQSQIQAFKNVQLSGAEAGLVAYYPFNQGISGGNNTGLTTLDDRSPTNADGTLTGFSLTGSTSNWAGPSALAEAPGLGCCPTNLYVNGIITSGSYKATVKVHGNGTAPNGANVIFKVTCD